MRSRAPGRVLLAVALLAIVLAPVASAHLGAWHCEINASTHRWECEGVFQDDQRICYVEWTDNEADSHYHDDGASVTRATCVGRGVLDRVGFL